MSAKWFDKLTIPSKVEGKPSLILLVIILVSGLSVLGGRVCSAAEAKSARAIEGHPHNASKKYEIQDDQLEYQTRINVANYGTGVPAIFGVDSSSGELVSFRPWTGVEIKRVNLPSISPNNTNIGLAGSQNNELYYINGDYDPGQVYVLDPLYASIIRQFQITGEWGVAGLGYQSSTSDSYLYTSGCEAGDMHRYTAVNGAGPIFYWGEVGRSRCYRWG